MILRDIQRQKTWVRECQFQVNEFSEPTDAQHGLVQAFNVTDKFGRTEEILYYFDDMQMCVPYDETPEWFDVKWMGTYFKCIPVDPPKDAPKTERPDWDKINLGKCRHGILCAAIQSGELSVKTANDTMYIEHMLTNIEKLAEFSMTGKIPE